TRPLRNLGQTFGHALEAFAGYSGRLLHGEAVAIGIALDSVYSQLSGLIGSRALERILSTFEALGLQLYSAALLENIPHAPEGTLSVFEGLQEFREHLGGELTLMLLNQIGSAINVHQVDEALYRRAIHILKER
ncbi:MAG: 3-dehydroquinate synthase, partial [Planctomycetes bacterium]|nr:3-dehydroquinate synthase [Planctomycetota bacterium]